MQEEAYCGKIAKTFYGYNSKETEKKEITNADTSKQEVIVPVKRGD